MTAVGFEPTPFRTSALSWRLRPLGHAVSWYRQLARRVKTSSTIYKETKWTRWDLNPGPSACEADVIPLHHEPDGVLGFPRHKLEGGGEVARIQHPRIELGTYCVLGSRHNH